MLSNKTNHLTIAQALSDKLIATMDSSYAGMGDKLSTNMELATSFSW